MKYAKFNPDNYTKIKSSVDDLPVFDGRGNILNEEAKLTFGKEREKQRNKYYERLDIRQMREYSLIPDNDNRRYEYNDLDMHGAYDTIVRQITNSVKRRIAAYRQSLSGLKQFMFNLMQLNLIKLDIDPSGAASIVYIRHPVNSLERQKLEDFVQNSSDYYGSYLQLIDKDKHGNLVYKIIFGTEEQHGSNLKQFKERFKG